MARNPDLEAILDARYALETAEPSQKAECRAQLDSLIQRALAKVRKESLSPRAFIEITAEPYREYKLAKKKEERARLSRVR